MNIINIMNGANIDTNGQLFAWILTSLSNILWLFVFLPQLYKNYKSKTSDAISLSLLCCLIFGDIFSLMSAIAKQLNHVIIYTIIYHIILSAVIVSQTIYYRIYNIILHENINNSEEVIPLFNTNYINPFIYSYYYLSFSEFVFIGCGIVSVFTCLLLLIFLQDNLLLADLIAWSATFIFISARIPQILLNYNRKSTEGLSILSFIIINIANFLFLSSILILLLDIPKENHSHYIKENIQWIIGSFSTTFFDLIIFHQFYIYKNN